MPNALVPAAARGLPPVTRVSPAVRRQLEAAVERLIAVLDTLDGDPDLEPSTGFSAAGVADEVEIDADEENSLGWSESEGERGSLYCADRDLEDEHDGCEPDADEEPSIGWSEAESLRGTIAPAGLDSEDRERCAPERHGEGFIGVASEDDDEAGGDDEPWLGAPNPDPGGMIPLDADNFAAGRSDPGIDQTAWGRSIEPQYLGTMPGGS